MLTFTGKKTDDWDGFRWLSWCHCVYL